MKHTDRHPKNWPLGRRALILAASVLSLGIVGLPSATMANQAMPQAPGGPQEPVEVFNETFENGVDATAISLADYVGAGGQTYTADPHWLRVDQCNDIVVRAESPTFPSGFCVTPNAKTTVRRLADVLGQLAAGVQGSADFGNPVNGSSPSTRMNHATTAWSGNANGPSDAIVIQSTPLGLVAPEPRFYTTSIDVAETSCHYQGGTYNSRLNFFLLVDGQELSLNALPIRACTDSGVSYYTTNVPGAYVAAGRYFSDSSHLLTPTEIVTAQIGMRNEVGNSDGNDFAYDNVRLVDATPRLDKGFAPTRVQVGGISTLTLTVTNTADLAEKQGWAFTDRLPSGLSVADPDNLGGTCVAQVTAPAGSPTVTVTDGLLAHGQASCTITVDVTDRSSSGVEPAPTTYQNCAGSIDNPVGIDLPTCAEVEFYAPAVEPHTTSPVASPAVSPAVPTAPRISGLPATGATSIVVAVLAVALLGTGAVMVALGLRRARR